MNKPNVFVSSTCYDLNQIRRDLQNFFIELRLTPMLSDDESFSINPNKNTIENCIENVNKFADILILIIGNRYGKTADSGKSITNLEYLTAKNKGIPIYVFILKEVLHTIPIWENNNSADFTKIVDSPKIFEFIKSVKDEDKQWFFGFETAQDIIETLRSQFSYLFKESLDIRYRINKSNLPSYWKELTPKAITIILEKAESWEEQYFQQVLEDELFKYEDLYNDFNYRILLQVRRTVSGIQDLISWMSEKQASLLTLVNSFNRLMKEVFPKYYGNPGEPSDLKGLFYIAKTLVKIFIEMIEWSIDINSTIVIQEAENLRDILSRFCDSAINRIWNFPKLMKEKIAENIERRKKGKSGFIVEITLVIDIEEGLTDLFEQEIERLKKMLFNKI